MKRNYDDWIKAYIDYASFSEAPTRMHFWTAVSTIAGALRRRVWLDMAYFKWCANFYVVLVAPPLHVAEHLIPINAHLGDDLRGNPLVIEKDGLKEMLGLKPPGCLSSRQIAVPPAKAPDFLW